MLGSLFYTIAREAKIVYNHKRALMLVVKW